MKPRNDSISDLLSIIAPGRRDVVALAASYCDTSTRDGHLVLASYMFRKSKVAPFEKEWQRMLDKYELPFFRMSACNGHEWPFDKITKDQCDEVARIAISIIIKYAEVGHHVSVKTSDFDAIITPDGIARNPFSFLIHAYLNFLKLYMEDTNPTGRIAHIFESGDDGEGDAGVIIRIMFASRSRREEFKYRSHTFSDKSDALGTQAADILAWHAGKHQLRLDAGNTKMRGDYAALRSSIRHKSFRFTPDSLHQLVDTLTAIAGGPGGNRLAGIIMHESNPKILRNDTARDRLVGGG